ncbi:MAG: hypothetical protein WA426_12550, partial [Silvibacterium sp.]
MGESTVCPKPFGGLPLGNEANTRERVPLDWAATQNNLGSVLGTLGEQESGTGWLEEAREAIGLAWG